MKVTFKFGLPPLLGLFLGLGGCGDGETAATPDAGLGSAQLLAKDVPIDGIGAEEVRGFNDGDGVFDTTFRPVDGLGPLYIRTACGSCHADGLRGPGLVQKMSIVEADGVTAAPDQSALPWGHTVRQGLVVAVTPIVPPDVPNLKMSIRLGPPVLGRGYMEAVTDDEILRVAGEQAARTDGIHGRANHLADGSIGRFGVKARLPTLEQFAADAFQGDMGLTNPLRPDELPNPDGLTDDMKPGVDVDQAHLDKVTFYLQRIAIPKRVGLTDAGRAAFDTALCSACHVPSLRTSAGAAVNALANIDAPIYTDLLLHDMGPVLADGVAESQAGGTDFRTAPLVGLRFLASYLHDGRAKSVADAIEAHDGEAAVARNAFHQLSAADQAALLQFVEAL